MCGIAGIIYKNGNGAHRIGRDITSMLQSMKHRGPDSTGYALYHTPSHELTVRVKLADSTTPRDLDFTDDIKLYTGDGKGAFVPVLGVLAAGNVSANEVAVGDLDGDLRPDLVLLNSGNDNIDR